MLRRFFIFVLLLAGSISISFSLPESQEKKQEKKKEVESPFEVKPAEIKIDRSHFPAMELTKKFVKSPEGKRFLDWTQGLNTKLEDKDYPPYTDEMCKVLIQVVVEKMLGFAEKKELDSLPSVDYFFKLMQTLERKKSVFYFMLNYYLSLSRQEEAMTEMMPDKGGAVVLEHFDKVDNELEHQKLVIHSLGGVFLSFVPEKDQEKLEPVKKGWEKEQENFFKRKK